MPKLNNNNNNSTSKEDLPLLSTKEVPPLITICVLDSHSIEAVEMECHHQVATIAWGMKQTAG
jgi:hypothetical protein